MITISLTIILLAVSVHSLDCPTGQQPCGSLGCYDPSTQGCSSSGSIIQCINSCNGTCYSNSQYCYNNTKVCNNGESVCDVKTFSYFGSTGTAFGLNCYNTSQLKCANSTLCLTQYSCGSQCLMDYNAVCANNDTLCRGFNYWNYYYTNRYVKLCGPWQTCYDSTTSVCLNGTTVCQGLNARLCGSTCYNPDAQNCTDGVVRCISSCNGTCYSNAQYCHNNTKVCNNGESVCDVKTFGSFGSTGTAFGLNCYNTSQLKCANSTLCLTQYSCGSQCLMDYNNVCVNNETLCAGFYFWNYYYANRYVKLCGPRQLCYDNTTSVCLNGTTVCQGLNARLCGSTCYNPDTQNCTGGIVQCVNSCNGTCYSNSQYCYNNTKVCNNGESVCDVKSYGLLASFPLGLTCYNASQLKCANSTLCLAQYSCGSHCLMDSNAVCVNNVTLCTGFNYWNYYYTNRYVKLCGSRQACYDNTTSMCFDDNSTVCPVGSQLCDGVCYNPQSQYCIRGNNTIFCLANPLSPNCPTTSTARINSSSSTTLTTTPVPIISNGSCCPVQNCTEHSDCCLPGSSECQCFRHSQTDVYGSCVNPNVTPVCGDSCPVRGKCRYDFDCCKCQCAEITLTGLDGQLLTKKQCVRR